MKRALCVGATLLVLACARPLQAQTVTPREGLTLGNTLVTLMSTTGGGAVGQTLEFATALEIANTPFGTSSSGFAFTLDPNTGLQIRKASTFGPAFAERAITSGAGKIGVTANFLFANYERLGKDSLDQLTVSRTRSTDPNLTRTGTASLVLSARTMVINGVFGVTDNLDVAVAVPIVSVKVDGITWITNGRDQIIQQAEGGGVSNGIGDIALTGKFRLLQFGEGQPDPGGIAVLGTVRLPTGDSDNLRGLGVTRTLGQIVISGGRGPFRPHVNAGYEIWSEGIAVPVDFAGRQYVTVRDQAQYAFGFELEAAPKLTILLDLLGRHVLGGGRVRLTQATITDPRINSIEVLTATSSAIRKISLAPGLKWNLKGKILVSLNALVSLSDTGLHDRFTPVVGVDLTF